jgi:hypothetical protein
MTTRSLSWLDTGTSKTLKHIYMTTRSLSWLWFILEQFRQCGLFWNSFDSVVYFGTVSTVWFILEQFRECGLFCFSFYFRYITVWNLLVLFITIEIEASVELTFSLLLQIFRYNVYKCIYIYIYIYHAMISLLSNASDIIMLLILFFIQAAFVVILLTNSDSNYIYIDISKI